MRRTRREALFALLAACALATLLLGPRPVFTEPLDGAALEAGDVAALSTQGDIEVYLNVMDDYAQPFTDEPSYVLKLSTSSTVHDNVRWQVFAAQSDEFTKVSGDLSADYVESTDEQATINIAGICEAYLADAEEPRLVVRAELLAGGEVIGSGEQDLTLQRPYYGYNFVFSEDVNKTVAGVQDGINPLFQLFTYNAASPWGSGDTYAMVTSVKSSDERIATAELDAENGYLGIDYRMPGTVTLTFNWECEDDPTVTGSFDRVFEVVSQDYLISYEPDTGIRYVLPGSEASYIVRPTNRVWDEQTGAAVCGEALSDGDTIHYEISTDYYSPEGSSVTADADDPLRFVVHVPDTAQAYDSVYVTAWITDKSGETRYKYTGCAADVRSAYYEVRLTDAEGSEMSSVTFADGQETVVVFPRLYRVSADGASEVADVTWTFYNGDGLDATKTDDGGYELVFRYDDSTASDFSFGYETSNDAPDLAEDSGQSPWFRVYRKNAGGEEPNTKEDLAEVAKIDSGRADQSEYVFLYPEGSSVSESDIALWLQVCRKDDGTRISSRNIAVEETGTYTRRVTFTGTGSYTGSLSTNIVVAPVTVKIADVPFQRSGSLTGKGYETVTALVDGKQRILEYGKDYWCSYEGELMIGEDYLFSYGGKGSYYAINGNLLSSSYSMVGDIARTTVSVGGLTYTGKALTPKIAVAWEDGYAYSWMEAPARGIDYTVSFRDARGNAVSSPKGAGTYTAIVTGCGLYTGTQTAKFTVAKKAQALTVKNAKVSKTFGNAAFSITSAAGVSTNGDGVLAYTSGNKAVATITSAGKVTIKGAGTAKITVYAKAGTNYAASAKKTITLTVKKAANTIKASGKTATVKFAKLKTGKQTVKRASALALSGAKGTVTYAKASGNAKISINARTGNLTIQKGLAKGAYKVKVKVKAAGNANYKGATKTVTVTIKVC